MLFRSFIATAGIATLPTIPQKPFPDIDIEIVNVSIEYPGAAPEEVESGVCTRIEEEVDGIEGIDRIQSVAAEGATVGEVFADLIARYPGLAGNLVDDQGAAPNEAPKHHWPILAQRSLPYRRHGPCTPSAEKPLHLWRKKSELKSRASHRPNRERRHARRARRRLRGRPVRRRRLRQRDDRLDRLPERLPRAGRAVHGGQREQHREYGERARQQSDGDGLRAERQRVKREADARREHGHAIDEAERENEIDGHDGRPRS